MKARAIAEKSWTLWNDYYKDGKKSSEEILSELEADIEAFSQTHVIVQSKNLPCSHCGRPLKEHSKDLKLCPNSLKNFY